MVQIDTDYVAVAGLFDYVDQMLLETLAPICMAVGLLFIYFLHYAFVLQYSRTYTRQKMFGRYCALFFLLTYLVLPAVTTSIFGAFPCMNVDPDHTTPGVSFVLSFRTSSPP